MKKTLKTFGIIAFVAIIGFPFTSCITPTPAFVPAVTVPVLPITATAPIGDGTLRVQGFNETPRDYVILGVFQVERENDFELTYADVMAEALTIFPNVHAFVNLRIDRVFRFDGSGERQQRFVATAIAIQFN